MRAHSSSRRATTISAAAEGYQANADRYVKGRPDYPPEIAAWLRDVIGLHAGMTVIDLGAGTGKFTPRLLETGAQVIAVEPVPQMLEKLSAALPQVKTLAGTADAIPLPDESVDAVVCAQSFHWFATPQALAEIQRILKPGGKLGLVWNMRDARVGWVRKLNQIVDSHEGDAPRFYTGEWRKLFPFKGFEPLQEQVFMLGHRGAVPGAEDAQQRIAGGGKLLADRRKIAPPSRIHHAVTDGGLGRDELRAALDDVAQPAELARPERGRHAGVAHRPGRRARRSWFAPQGPNRRD